MEDHRLELWKGERQIVSIALLSWVALRWYSIWKHDAWLAEPLRFENWLSRLGIPDAQQRREGDERRELERQQEMERWEQAMPVCLRPLWPKGFGECRDDIESARSILNVAVPDQIDRVRSLYHWFGSGAGPWSGYPSYESAVVKLLMEYPVETLIGAIESEPVSSTELLGAARLLGGWDFGQRRKQDRSRCSESLRQQMFECVRRQGIADNLERFRRAFGLSG